MYASAKFDSYALLMQLSSLVSSSLIVDVSGKLSANHYIAQFHHFYLPTPHPDFQSLITLLLSLETKYPPWLTILPQYVLIRPLPTTPDFSIFDLLLYFKSLKLSSILKPLSRKIIESTAKISSNNLLNLYQPAYC